LARALAKPHLRLIAVDDGAFRREQRFAPLVAVVYSVPGYVEGVLRSHVRVDGNDATERIARMLLASPHLEGARAVLLDGVAVGGFNLVDLRELSERLVRPVVAVTREAPDFRKIRAAIQKYFPREFEARWGLLRAHRLFRVPTAERPILAAVVGARRKDAAELVRRTTMRGRWPEPLRLAHLIAHAIGTPDILARRAGGTKN
jgi:endonuclease V-like protein UPF0215 family